MSASGERLGERRSETRFEPAVPGELSPVRRSRCGFGHAGDQRALPPQTPSFAAQGAPPRRQLIGAERERLERVFETALKFSRVTVDNSTTDTC